MGNLQASEMARLTDLDTGLRWHLEYNHYPPVRLSLLDACKAAITAYQEEDYARPIDMPAGVQYRGLVQAPASALVEEFHLGAFIQAAEDDDDYISDLVGSEDLDLGDDSWRDNADEDLDNDDGEE